MSESNAKEHSSIAATRTELVWLGKRTQVDRVALPFHVVETVPDRPTLRDDLWG